MPKRTATHKLKMHQKKLKKLKDKKKEEGSKEAYEKSAKDYLITEVWDFEQGQLAFEKYGLFLSHLQQRLREDVTEFETKKINLIIRKVEEAMKK